ncbi:MAG: caspase family protein [Pseudomonadota bacterium]
MMMRSFAFMLGFVLLIQPAHADVHALVIGTDYIEADDPRLELANPVVDARMVSASLKRSAATEVTLLEEPDAKLWESELDLFVNSLAPDDIALLYYAGHGFQIEGRNYFLAADGVSLIPLEDLIRRLTEKARGAIVVVDACRNNPLASEQVQPTERSLALNIAGVTRSVESITLYDVANAGPGLAQLGNLRGLSAVVFFSTDPGNVAEDGATPGKGSPFATIFARQIKRRQSLDETFRKTAIEVNKKTEGRQSPWRQGDLPFNVFVGGMRVLPIP